MRTFQIRPKGPFSLRESAMFGFGQRHDTVFDGTMRLAFCVDGYRAQAAVALTQDESGTVRGVIAGVHGSASTSVIVGQTARVLSLDHDATGFVEVGQRDEVVRRLLQVAPGLRPPLFYSPYEAAAWAILSARRPSRMARAFREKLSAAAGASFDVAGETMHAFPRPEDLLAMGTRDVCRATGMDATRAERLVAVAEAAGMLDAHRLLELPLDSARALLRTLPGIGPFYANLVLIRATGATDILPLDEPKLAALVGELYHLGGPAMPLLLSRIAGSWAPWRTWVAVLVRAAGARLLLQQRSTDREASPAYRVG